MYDPEFALELERESGSDQEFLAGVEERWGVDHPWAQRVRLVVDILQKISRKENDLMNCFDEERKKAIRSEIEKLSEATKLAIEV